MTQCPREMITPGHGIIADALIMHGLIKILHIEGKMEGWAERRGERFAVCADRPELNWIDQWEPMELLEIAAEAKAKGKGEESEEEQVPYFGLVYDLYRSTVDRGNFPSWISDLREALYALKSDFDLSEEHREKRGEGRARPKKRGYYTLYLPLSGVYGKYVVENYGIRQSQYAVCATCFALSTLGYIYGTVKARVERRSSSGGGHDVFNLTFIPRGRTSLRTLMTLQRMAGLVEMRPGDLNELGAVVYMLSVGETIYAVRESVDILVWITQRAGNYFQRTVGVNIFRGDRLLEAIAQIKYRAPRWPKIARQLGSSLNVLGEYLAFGGDVYHVIRSVMADLGRKGGKLAELEGLAEALKKIG
ncbi:CRISPR-associated protein [Pyrobaculum neutrophilum]|uniref:Uncharacterized protein n=1 Tax=Pyrobaculum neutrophilum (strain DSM 2338 / JCM 9278 / NBRC 100436 / V24Sta) TaxID=444157 RepID=B1YE49_PYRNV|nr:CRISPR-associated protein [Pyrobaculum neutrophilum]ACB40062.1 conserved hypothetical protein [Pyrobaculum neutrophilum V24Sta]